jgi:16S rRNA processing protein RimM
LGHDVLLAAVIGAQGLKGEVKVKTFTATPEALSRYGVLHTRDGRKLVVTAFRPAKKGEAAIAFEGVRDRTAAEALKGVELFVDRASLPETAENEFYHADLIGLEARDSEGRTLGKVMALHNFGASDVIELQRAASEGRGGDSVHLAFTRETVPVINIADGYIIVAVPEDDEDTDHVE